MIIKLYLVVPKDKNEGLYKGVFDSAEEGFEFIYSQKHNPEGYLLTELIIWEDCNNNLTIQKIKLVI